jgi:ribosomal protein S17E
VDYNNDGKLDLIIASNNERKKPFSLELKQKVEKSEALMDKYQSLADKALKNNDDNAFDLMDKRDEIRNELAGYYSSHFGPSAHVFVSLRK